MIQFSSKFFRVTLSHSPQRELRPLVAKYSFRYIKNGLPYRVPGILTQSRTVDPIGWIRREPLHFQEGSVMFLMLVYGKQR